jgi:superfamily II DNA or RNA helicase
VLNIHKKTLFIMEKSSFVPSWLSPEKTKAEAKWTRDIRSASDVITASKSALKEFIEENKDESDATKVSGSNYGTIRFARSKFDSEARLLELRRLALSIVRKGGVLSEEERFSLSPLNNASSKNIERSAERLTNGGGNESAKKNLMNYFNEKGPEVLLNMEGEKVRQVCSTTVLHALSFMPMTDSDFNVHVKMMLSWSYDDVRFGCDNQSLLDNRCQWLQELPEKVNALLKAAVRQICENILWHYRRNICSFLDANRNDLFVTNQSTVELLGLCVSLKPPTLLSSFQIDIGKSFWEKVYDSCPRIVERILRSKQLREPQIGGLNAIRKHFANDDDSVDLKFHQASLVREEFSTTFLQLRLQMYNIFLSTYCKDFEVDVVEEKVTKLDAVLLLLKTISVRLADAEAAKQRPALLVAPTGVGKTLIFAGELFGKIFLYFFFIHLSFLLACPFMFKKLPKKVLVVTSDSNGTSNAIQAFESNFLQKYDIIKDLHKENQCPKVFRITKQTTDLDIRYGEVFVWNYRGAKHDGLLEKFPINCFDLIIIDEAHHSTSESYTRIGAHFATARRVLVTATPARLDGEIIDAVKIYEFSMLDAIRQGYVKEPVWSPLPVNGVVLSNKNKLLDSFEKIEALAYVSRSFQKAVEGSDLCQREIIAYATRLLLEGRKTGMHPQGRCIAYADSVASAKSITSLWIKLCPSLNIKLVHGESNKADRRIVLNGLKADVKSESNVDVVVNCKALGEGFDEANLCIAVFFHRVSSVMQLAQYIGRCVRKCTFSPAGQQYCQIVSHPGTGLKPLWDMYCKGTFSGTSVSLESHDEEYVIQLVTNGDSIKTLTFRECA